MPGSGRWDVEEDLVACAVAHCGRRHGSHLVMCSPCWQRVPPDVRKKVGKLYDDGRRRPGYAEACAAAIKAAAA
jgi:hypothetical protein